MQQFLYKLLMIIIALDIFVLGILIIFLINTHINVKRKVKERQFYLNVLEISKNSDTTKIAARKLSITLDEFIKFCLKNSIELPEKRIEISSKMKELQEQEQTKIKEEEDAWHAEQERISKERRTVQEADEKKRKEHFKRLGYK